MGRLTRRIIKKFPNHTTEAIELNSEWGKMDIHANEEFYDIAEKLAHYEDMEEQSRLIEVVRCKECEYYDTSNCGEGAGWCKALNAGRFDDWYCSSAKLKELEGDK